MRPTLRETLRERARDTGGAYGPAVVLVVGVFLGSALWWFLLSGGASLLRTWLTPHALAWVNHASGVIIAVFGVVALVSIVR